MSQADPPELGSKCRVRCLLDSCVFNRHRKPKWVDRSQRCVFCGKRKDQVDKLVAGPGVCICNECVRLCIDIPDKEATPSG